MDQPLESSHPEPIAQAGSGTVQKLAEVAAVAALFVQVTAGVRARRAGRAADELARQDAALAADRAAVAAARAGWAPARHPEWLADAGLHEVARAWGHAAPYEHADPGAAVALDLAEARLREIHPYAMRRYDSLRRSGRSRVDAMTAAVPEFFKHPNPRPAPRDARRGLYLPLTGPGAGGQAQVPGGPALAGVDAVLVRRVMGIISQLNDRAVAAGEGPLSPQVIQMALAGRTNIPPSVIRRIVEGLREGGAMVPAPADPRAAAAPRSVSQTGPAAADWPATARGGVGTVALRQAAGVRGRGPARPQHRAAQQPGRAPGLRP